MPIFTPEKHLHVSICKQKDSMFLPLYIKICIKAKQDYIFSSHIPKQKYSFPFNESKRLFTAQKLQFPSTDIIIYMTPTSMSEMASYKRLLNACCKHWVAERGTGTRTKKFGRWVFFIRFFDRNVKRLS